MSPLWHPSPDDLPRYARLLIDNALRAQPWALTWWCSHDVDRRLTGFDDLEYDLGLLTVHNELKPIGIAVSQAIAEQRATMQSPPRNPATLVLPSDRTPDLPFADTFFTMIDKGQDPSISLDSPPS